jgi:hypothetical protein
MKYVYENGARTFRGYFFWNSKPVEITDRATLAAIQKEDGFRVYEEVEAKPVVQERPVIHLPAKRGWPLGKPRK